MLEILNTCLEQKEIPYLVESENKECILCNQSIARYGITYKMDNNTYKEEKDMKDIPSLCFYDQAFFDKYTGKEKKETFENATWNYGKDKDGTIKGEDKLIRYYNRFKQ